jgi:uncharacterized membrane protein YtjA (UPF0391 family)
LPALRAECALEDKGGQLCCSAMEGDMTLLKWALICLLISLVAGAFGFTGVARGAAQLSKILFFIFLVIFIVILIMAISAGQLVF